MVCEIHLSNIFPITNDFEQGDALSPLIFTFALDYTIRRDQVKCDGLKLNDTLQSLVYADNVNILGGIVRTIEKNTEPSVVATKENGKEGNADKNQYMFMLQDQNEIRRQDRLCEVFFN